MTWLSGTQESACSSALMPCAQRATGGQVMVMAISPEFSAESDLAEAPGLHAGRLALELLDHVGQRLDTGLGLFTVAFIVSASKNFPP